VSFTDRRSVPLAFLVGLSLAIPVVVLRYFGMETFVARAISIAAWLLYLGAILSFVLGPQYWSTYRFVPVDGIGQVLQRCAAWWSGGLLCVAILEITERVPLFRTVFRLSISDQPCGFAITLPT